GLLGDYGTGHLLSGRLHADLVLVLLNQSMFQKPQKLLFALALLLALSAAAAAATDYVSTIRSNSTPGTPTAPRKTIDKAASVLLTGDAGVSRPQGTANDPGANGKRVVSTGYWTTNLPVNTISLAAPHI